MESLWAMAHTPTAKMLKLDQLKEMGSSAMDPLQQQHTKDTGSHWGGSTAWGMELTVAKKKPESRLWDCVNVCEPQEERNSSGSWRKGLCSHSPYRQEPVHQDDGL